MKNDSSKGLTPELVEARLAEVNALNRLCASLAEAGRAPRSEAEVRQTPTRGPSEGQSIEETADDPRQSS